MNMTFNPSIRYRPSELIKTMISSRTRFDDFMDFAGHQGVNEDVAKRVISKLRETYSFNSVQKQLQVARLLSNPNIPRDVAIDITEEESDVRPLDFDIIVVNTPHFDKETFNASLLRIIQRFDENEAFQVLRNVFNDERRPNDFEELLLLAHPNITDLVVQHTSRLALVEKITMTLDFENKTSWKVLSEAAKRIGIPDCMKSKVCHNKHTEESSELPPGYTDVVTRLSKDPLLKHDDLAMLAKPLIKHLNSTVHRHDSTCSDTLLNILLSENFNADVAVSIIESNLNRISFHTAEKEISQRSDIIAKLPLWSEKLNDSAPLCLAIKLGIPLTQSVIEQIFNLNCNVAFSTLLARADVSEDILFTFAHHYDLSFRYRVAVHPNTTPKVDEILPFVRQKMQEDGARSLAHLYNSPAFATLAKLDNLEVLANDYGYDLFEFKNVPSPSRITKSLIGSKHPHEVRFLFGSGCAETVTAISSLQTVMTNRKGKLDRHAYIHTLAAINEGIVKGNGNAAQRGLAVDAQSLREVWSLLSIEEIISVLNANGKDEALDVFRMLASLVMREDEDEAIHQKKLIRKWLNTNKNYGHELHRYLMNKQLRELGDVNELETFYQAPAASDEGMRILNKSLPEGITLILPQDSMSLRKLGRMQSHCVGSKFYAERCADGASIIFALSTGESRDQVFTFQFNRMGRMEQAKGFANSSVPSDITEIANALYPKIEETIEKMTDTACNSLT